jgi:hypothetical protein
MLLTSALAPIGSCVANTTGNDVNGENAVDARFSSTASRQHMDYSQPPPFGATQLWIKVLRLLNEHDGQVSKERLEAVLGVRVGAVEREALATTYRIRKGVDWYLNARLTIFEKGFDVSRAPELARGYSEWTVEFPADKSVGPAQGGCLRADRVRSDLLASGWTSPWLRWGIAEERSGVAPGGERSPPEAVPPLSNFFRQANVASGHRDELPNGQVFSDGDRADSCVTGFSVRAPP